MEDTSMKKCPSFTTTNLMMITIKKNRETFSYSCDTFLWFKRSYTVDICFRKLTFHLGYFISCFQLLFSLDFTSKIPELYQTSSYIKFLWKFIPSFPSVFHSYSIHNIRILLYKTWWIVVFWGFFSFIFPLKLKICNFLYSLLDPVTSGTLSHIGSKPLCHDLLMNFSSKFAVMNEELIQSLLKGKRTLYSFSAWPFVVQ